jgi:hypothetical protein
MERYELKDKCLFVDATDRETNTKKPVDIGASHAMDKSTPSAKYLKLNDGAAFIARFIVMGVDTELIAQILVSEYGSAVRDPAAEVRAVVKMLEPYLKPRSFARPYQAPRDHGGGQHSGHYDLDFRVNWFGTGVFKGPL